MESSWGFMKIQEQLKNMGFRPNPNSFMEESLKS